MIQIHTLTDQKYIYFKNKKETSRLVVTDSSDVFFESTAAKVKRFTPYYRNVAERCIFNFVKQLELEHILPNNHHALSQIVQHISRNNFIDNNFHKLISTSQFSTFKSSGYVPMPTYSPATSNVTVASYLIIL